MLVRLKNIGMSTRIISDLNRVPRTFRPNQEQEIDLDPRQVQRYAGEAGRPKARLLCTLIDDYPDNTPDEEEGKNADGVNRHGFALRAEHMRQGQGLKEAVGTQEIMGMHQRAHRAERAQRGEEIPHDAPNGPEGTEEVASDSSNPPGLDAPIQHNAQSEGATPPVEPQPAKEPETAGELLAILDSGEHDYDEQTVLRLARKVLPRNAMPQRPKPAQIMSSLRAGAAQDELKRAEAEAAEQ